MVAGSSPAPSTRKSRPTGSRRGVRQEQNTVSEPAAGASRRAQMSVIRRLCAAVFLTLLMAFLVAAVARSGTATPAVHLQFGCDSEGCQQLDTSPETAESSASGLFSDGHIDLTGDGRTEHVRREAEQVMIYEDGVEVWRSPAEWRVADAALGDPTNDGRGELMLALWKEGLDGLEPPDPGKEDTPRSRPFIIGYRGGMYRTLWGGSAVSRPIHEIELGDVSGDGLEELVVLEGEGSDGRTVSLWRWHGWGFTLIWRSAPGSYRDLIVGQGGIISVAVDRRP